MSWFVPTHNAAMGQWVFLVPALLRDCSLCWDHLEVVQTPTLDTALLSSSRVGTDLGQTSGSEDDASPV